MSEHCENLAELLARIKISDEDMERFVIRESMTSAILEEKLASPKVSHDDKKRAFFDAILKCGIRRSERLKALDAHSRQGESVPLRVHHAVS